MHTEKKKSSNASSEKIVLATTEPGLTKADLEILKKPFPHDHLNVKVQTLNKERTRALLVLYLQHTNVQNRLDDIDPCWSTEVLSEETQNQSYFVKMKLTLKGVSRENVGEGSDPKSAYSDALKRCAMLFGVGRYLYDSTPVWVDYNEAKDRFRQWSVADYEKSVASAVTPTPTPGFTTTTLPSAKKPLKRTREELNRVLMRLYRPFLVKFPATHFPEFLTERYHVTETRFMTLEQLENLVQLMEEKLKSVA